MAHLQHLDGRPQTWAELYERHAAYYNRPTTFESSLLRVLKSGEWMETYEVAYYARWSAEYVRSSLASMVAKGLVETEYDERNREYWFRIPAQKASA